MKKMVILCNNKSKAEYMGDITREYTYLVLGDHTDAYL